MPPWKTSNVFFKHNKNLRKFQLPLIEYGTVLLWCHCLSHVWEPPPTSTKHRVTWPYFIDITLFQQLKTTKVSSPSMMRQYKMILHSRYSSCTKLNLWANHLCPTPKFKTYITNCNIGCELDSEELLKYNSWNILCTNSTNMTTCPKSKLVYPSKNNSLYTRNQYKIQYWHEYSLQQLWNLRSLHHMLTQKHIIWFPYQHIASH
jgi:hypothetical protein